MKSLRLALLSLVVVPLAACGGSPENLAKDVQTVFEKGDMDGARSANQVIVERPRSQTSTMPPRAAPVNGAAHSGQRKNSAIRIRTGIGTPSIQSNK